jgi:hypothetical protein
MFIDYTSLNKACSKDEYPLPHICQIVDSTASCELLSFLDAYSSYHQISLVINDEEKTTFITPFGIFCYTKLVFDLKNRGGGYVTPSFKAKIGCSSYMCQGSRFHTYDQNYIISD